MTTSMAFAKLILLSAFCTSTLIAQRPIKVFLSVDMEGIGGVVTSEQLGPTGFEYAKFREFMTAEALAQLKTDVHHIKEDSVHKNVSEFINAISEEAFVKTAAKNFTDKNYYRCRSFAC